MASYAELFEVFRGGTVAINDLHQKIVAATMLAAESIRTESTATTNHTNRIIWAKFAFENPETAGLQLLPAILAQNSSATQSQILNATDSSIQTAVDAAVDVFADGTQKTATGAP